jgi:hypothetical protein
MLGSRRRGGFSKTARSHRHSRHHTRRRARHLEAVRRSSPSPRACQVPLGACESDRGPLPRRTVGGISRFLLGTPTGSAFGNSRHEFGLNVLPRWWLGLDRLASK